MTQSDDVGGGAKPVAGLASLLRVSARECPDAILFQDDAGVMRADEAMAHIRRLVSCLRHVGFSRGQRVALLMGANTRSVLMLVALLQAELEPAVIPCGLGTVEIAARVGSAGAVALIGPTSYGDLDLGDTLLCAAALCETVRMIATFGPGPVDGAVDLWTSDHPPLGDDFGGNEAAMIVTFAGGGAPTPVSHDQAGLLKDALRVVDEAGLNPSKPLVSTIVPASLAGLVVGPFAALLGADGLVLHGPFDARGFLALQDTRPGADVVVPAVLESMARQAGLPSGDGALIVLTRTAEDSPARLPDTIGSEARPIVDLLAAEEPAIVVRRRSRSVGALQEGATVDSVADTFDAPRLQIPVRAGI